MMDRKLKSLEAKFNMVMLGMMNYINDYYPESNVTNAKDLAETIVSEKPEEPIAYFMKYIYLSDDYRHHILEGNDKFFMGHNYGEITGGNDEMIKNMFQFKSTWKAFNQDTQSYIKKCMKGLVLISEKYILALPE